eukprot:4431687-Amphidinium_carterae.2
MQFQHPKSRKELPKLLVPQNVTSMPAAAVRQSFEEWVVRATLAVTTWTLTMTARHHFVLVVKEARKNLKIWLNAPHQEKLKMEHSYLHGAERPVPPRVSSIEAIMRVELLEKLPPWLARKCTIQGHRALQHCGCSLNFSPKCSVKCSCTRILESSTWPTTSCHILQRFLQISKIPAISWRNGSTKLISQRCHLQTLHGGGSPLSERLEIGIELMRKKTCVQRSRSKKLKGLHELCWSQRVKECKNCRLTMRCLSHNRKNLLLQTLCPPLLVVVPTMDRIPSLMARLASST